uniref:Uncharacterized protein n=1 Tax=Oryza nivara TaxID=4536 RepID=A0A0E0HWW6_ORYNI
MSNGRQYCQRPPRPKDQLELLLHILRNSTVLKTMRIEPKQTWSNMEKGDEDKAASIPATVRERDRGSEAQTGGVQPSQTQTSGAQQEQQSDTNPSPRVSGVTTPFPNHEGTMKA